MVTTATRPATATAKPGVSPLSGLKILMVAPQPFFEARGTPLSIAHRIRSLCGAGARVDLVTYPLGSGVSIDGLRIHRPWTVPGIRSVPIGPSIRKLILNTWMLPLLLRRLVHGRYDLLYSHEEAGFMCGLLSRLRRLPHIYDMHSNLVQNVQNYPCGRWRPIVWLVRAMRAAILRTSDVVLTICDDLEADMRRDAPDVPVFLIPNTRTEVDFVDGPAPTQEELARRHGLDDRPVALYIGSFEPYQGLELLVDAIAEIHAAEVPCQLLIVGGAEDQVVALRKTLEARGLGRAATVVPRVSPRLVDSYLALADVLLSPRNRGTNVPLKLYSFLKSGKPIVATRLPTHTQVLDDDTALLAEPDGKAFAEAIITAVTDGPRARQVAASAAARAAALHRADHYDELLHDAVRLATRSNGRDSSRCAE